MILPACSELLCEACRQSSFASQGANIKNQWIIYQPHVIWAGFSPFCGNTCSRERAEKLIRPRQSICLSGGQWELLCWNVLDWDFCLIHSNLLQIQTPAQGDAMPVNYFSINSVLATSRSVGIVFFKVFPPLILNPTKVMVLHAEETSK